MTREEKIEHLAKAVMTLSELGDNKTAYVLNEIRLEMKNQLKLPEGLEEAAEEYEKKHTYQRYDGGGLTPEYNATLAEAFIAGAQCTAPRWISVDEKLPGMDEEVIVLTDEHGTAPIYKIGFGHIVDVERCIDYNGWNCPGVKYWMPCPEIPNND